jgi:two-component system sensor histidine kinase KdpD
MVAAQRLDRMMTDLVGAGRLEAGSLAPAMESVDLIDVVSAACEGLVLPESIAITRDVPADLPFVTADPVLLHHVLANLIDNALRHAHSCVTLAARRGPEAVLFSVSDDGPGVPEAERALIFERFIRLAGSDRTDGSGLGLAIVKGFSDAMGMTVTVEPAPSGGASFTLAIPLPESHGR